MPEDDGQNIVQAVIADCRLIESLPQWFAPPEDLTPGVDMPRWLAWHEAQDKAVKEIITAKIRLTIGRELLAVSRLEFQSEPMLPGKTWAHLTVPSLGVLRIRAVTYRSLVGKEWVIGMDDLEFYPMGEYAGRTEFGSIKGGPDLVSAIVAMAKYQDARLRHNLPDMD